MKYLAMLLLELQSKTLKILKVLTLFTLFGLVIYFTQNFLVILLIAFIYLIDYVITAVKIYNDMVEISKVEIQRAVKEVIQVKDQEIERIYDVIRGGEQK